MDLAQDYDTAIEEFVTSWEELNLPGTSKYHILKFHIKDFCEATGHGLGLYNEQASESVHSDFAKTWERYKAVKTSGVYQKNVLRAVIDCYSGHLH